MRRDRLYYVYFLISSSRRALYLGMTSGLRNRVWQHKNKVFEGFSSKYNCTRLVYFEIYDDVRRAIAREKQLKRWSRAKKNALIERFNPAWRDLAEDWFKPETQGPSTPVRAIPTEGIANPAADGRSERQGLKFDRTISFSFSPQQDVLKLVQTRNARSLDSRPRDPN